MRSVCLLLVAVAALGYASAANLRERCSSNNDCAQIANANCSQNICACVKDYLPNLNGTMCHHKSEAYNATCKEDIDCQNVLGLKATCTFRFPITDNVTRCLCMLGNHYDSSSQTCKRNLQLNDRCSGDVDGACYLTLDGDKQHVRCAANGTCSCEDGYVADFDFMKCTINKTCTLNADCTELVNAECSSKGRCTCKSGYDAITDVGSRGERRIYCAKELRSPCSSPTDCVLNAECRDGLCSCLRDYLPSGNGLRCHHKAEAYKAPCEQNYECAEAMGVLAWCMPTSTGGQSSTPSGQCVCNPSAHYYNYSCYRSLVFGSRCSDDPLGRCYMPGDGQSQRTSCAANGTCACADGYTPSADLTHCSSSTQQWLASCAALLALLVWALV